jgi:DNA repair exonuclease SbcCD ATPase subunit
MAAHKARYAKARARVRTLQQQLDELIAPALPQHATYEAEVDARKARDKALVELAQAQSLLTLTGKSACTVCGTPVKTLATAMEAAKQQASALRRRLTDVEKYLGTMLTYREAYAAYDTARLTINATLAAHTASMNKLAKQAKTKQRLPELDATRTACSARVAEYNKLRQAAIDLGRQGRKAWQAAQTAISTQRQLQTQIARLQTTLPAKQTAAALTAARELLQTAKLRRREAGAVREAYVGAKAVYIAARAAHARDARARRMREQLQQWIDKLGKCRAYAHRDGLPQRVHTAALQLLEKRINPLLAALDAPFEVTADPQSARLLAVMQDGETFPTEALSGGQTVSLSIAYRLAVKELFAKHFDMLVLDEPTSWLDTRRMDCLMEVMMRLRRRAAQLNQQIIVVTHSDRLRRVFDQVLETV